MIQTDFELQGITMEEVWRQDDPDLVTVGLQPLDAALRFRMQMDTVCQSLTELQSAQTFSAGAPSTASDAALALISVRNAASNRQQRLLAPQAILQILPLFRPPVCSTARMPARMSVSPQWAPLCTFRGWRRAGHLLPDRPAGHPAAAPARHRYQVWGLVRTRACDRIAADRV